MLIKQFVSGPSILSILRGQRQVQLRPVLPDVRSVFSRYRTLIIGGLALMTFSRVCALVLPFSTKYLVDDVVTRRDARLLTVIALAIGAATAGQATATFVFERMLKRGGARLGAELRCMLHQHVMGLPIGYFDSNQTGTILSRIMYDVLGVRGLIGAGLFEAVGAVITTLLALGALLMVSAPLTFFAVGVLLVHSVSMRIILNRLRPVARIRAELTGQVTGRLTEALSGIRVIKTYRGEKRESAAFSAGMSAILANELKDYSVLAFVSFVTALTTGLGSLLLLYFGALQIISNTITMGDLTKFAALVALIIRPLQQVDGIAFQVSDALTSIERTREVIKETREDQNPNRTVRMKSVTGNVRFDNVSFSFGSKTVLDEISLVAAPGTLTALTGPSGAGKSTLISLVAGFHTPNAGNLYVDGIDLSRVDLDSYRPHVGVVFQESFLFNGSILENVAFSRPDACEREIIQACRIAHVDEFAERFEDKYDTVVGERGSKLSGGQKQRIAIARAILATPTILLFDEATSSLDSESEVLIQQGMKTLMEGRTTFVIAHRLSTVRRADQILFLDHGRILERGTHQTLMGLRGRYFDLCNSQAEKSGLTI